MKWNSNVSSRTMNHDPKQKIFGTLYGKVVAEDDIAFPEGTDINQLSSATQIEKHYPDLVNPSKAQTTVLKPLQNEK